MANSNLIPHANAVFEMREQRRFQKEEAAGTVFFSYSVSEFKLTPGGRLLYFPFEGVGDGDAAENRAFLLKRLEWFRLTPSHIKVKGEFYWQTAARTLYDVCEKDACVTVRTIRWKRPLPHETVLLDFLALMERQSVHIPATKWPARFSSWFAQRALPVLGVLCLPFIALGMLGDMLFSRKTSGWLEGFEEIDGRHYPRYSFLQTDGARVQRTDTAISLEESVSADEARRQLCQKLPRKITVRYSKRHPEKNSCRYL